MSEPMGGVVKLSPELEKTIRAIVREEIEADRIEQETLQAERSAALIEAINRASSSVVARFSPKDDPVTGHG